MSAVLTPVDEQSQDALAGALGLSSRQPQD